MAEALKRELETRGHSIDIEKVKPQKEHSFCGWWNIRMIKGECEIQPLKIWDASEYDAVLVGSPNWTRVSLPMARYLREIEGLRYKKIGLFSTTSLPSVWEWFFFSAYLLDLTFSRLVEKKGGRIIDSILLSSVFKKWDFESQYGKRAIRSFCDKLESPIRSLKEYFLEQREVGDTRILVIFFSIVLFFSLIFQVIASIKGFWFLTWQEYLSVFAIWFFSYFALLMILAGRTFLFWGKYLTAISLTALTTTIIMFLPAVHGRSVILGYILIALLISFFRNPTAVLVAGLGGILGYSFLLSNYPQKDIFIPSLDLPLCIFSIGMIIAVTQSLQRHFFNLLENQDEIEMARAFLEIKIEARTKELKELAESLDLKVKERTEELQEKVVELERFNKLAIGRELKMIELKNEIKGLKEELERLKGRE